MCYRVRNISTIFSEILKVTSSAEQGLCLWFTDRFLHKGWRGGSVRKAAVDLQYAPKNTETIHRWILLHFKKHEELSCMTLKWCNIFLQHPSVCFTYFFSIQQPAERRCNLVVFSYCVVELERATQQRENKRKVFPVRENVFTVYWKCEVENANERGMKRCAKQQWNVLSNNNRKM